MNEVLFVGEKIDKYVRIQVSSENIVNEVPHTGVTLSSNSSRVRYKLYSAQYHCNTSCE